MLILTRKPGESLYIGDDIKITIVELKGHQIRVGIDAPPKYRIYREEIYIQILEENKKASQALLGEEGAVESGLENLSAAFGQKSTEASPEGEKKKRLSSLSIGAPAVTSGVTESGSKESGPEVVIKRKRIKKDDE